MGFSEDFAAALGKSGFVVDPKSVPPAAVLETSLGSARQWLDSLESTTRKAVDEVTGEFGLNAALADDQVRIAPGLSGLLQVFDAAKVDVSISTVVDLCVRAIDAVKG